MTLGDLLQAAGLTGFLFVASTLLFGIAYGAAWLLHNRVLTPRPDDPFILQGYVAALPFGFVGMVAGFLTGGSRSPAVDALVPAILTFIGVVVAYLVGKSRARAAIAGFMVFVFSAELVFGATLGTYSRERSATESSGYKAQVAKADLELKVRNYRQLLGLPAVAPVEPAAKEE